MQTMMICNHKRRKQAEISLKIVKQAHKAESTRNRIRSPGRKINTNKSEARRTKPETYPDFLLSHNEGKHGLSFHEFYFNTIKTRIVEIMKSIVNQGWPEDDDSNQSVAANIQGTAPEQNHEPDGGAGVVNQQDEPATGTSCTNTGGNDGDGSEDERPSQLETAEDEREPEANEVQVRPEADAAEAETQPAVAPTTAEIKARPEATEIPVHPEAATNGEAETNNQDGECGDVRDNEDEEASVSEESEGWYYGSTDDEEEPTGKEEDVVVPDPRFMIMDDTGRPEMVEGKILLDVSAACEDHPFICLNKKCQRPFTAFNGITAHVNGKKCNHVYDRFTVINRGIRRNKEHFPGGLPTRLSTRKPPKSPKPSTSRSSGAASSNASATTPATPPAQPTPRPSSSQRPPEATTSHAGASASTAPTATTAATTQSTPRTSRPGPSRVQGTPHEAPLKVKIKPTQKRKRQRSEDTDYEDANTKKKTDGDGTTVSATTGDNLPRLEVKLENFEKIFKNLDMATKRRVREQIRQYNDQVQNPQIKMEIAKVQAEIVQGIENTMSRFNLMEIYLNCNNGHESLVENVEDFKADLDNMKKSVEQLDFSTKKF